MYIFSLFGFLAITLMAMIQGGDIGMFINIPSVLIVLPISIIFAIGATSIDTVKQAIRIATSEGQGWNEKQCLSAQHVFQIIGSSAVMLGWFGVILGAIAMASNIEKEVFADVFGPAMAVCLLTVLYGYAVKIVCFTASQRVKHFVIQMQQVTA